MLIKRLPLLLILFLTSLYAEAQKIVLDDFELTSPEVETLLPYSGQSLTDSNYVSYLFQSLVLEKLASADNQNRTWHVSENLQILQHASTDSRIPISIAAYKYTTENNLRLIRPPLRQRHNLVMSCPVRIISRSSSVTFTFNVTEYSNLTISSLQFDPGDGLGYRTVSVNDSLSVYYSDGGAKELKTKITSGNRTLYSHSQLCVLLQSSPHIIPFVLRPDHTQTIDTVVNGDTVSALVCTKYASGRDCLLKPFIVSEGFDPIDLARLADSCNDEGFNSCGRFIAEVWDYLPAIKDDYDLVYINWNYSDKDIRDNAVLLERILEKINTLKHSNGSSEKGVLMGVSMGGLIGRIALHNMEATSTPHEIDSFICDDTPNQGANVPLSLQYLWFLIEQYLQSSPLGQMINDDPTASQLKETINKYARGKSMQQMSYYYVDESGTSRADYHNSFYQNIVPPLPHGDNDCNIVNIALTNGGPFNASAYLTPEAKLLYAYMNDVSAVSLMIQYNDIGVFPAILLGLLFAPVANFNTFANINDGLNQLASSFCVQIKIWGIDFTTPYDYYGTKNYNGETCYDAFSYGSYYQVQDSLIINNIPPGLLPSGFNYNIAQRFMFIPKESSLDGNELTTPFNAYYTPNEAQYHTAVDNDNAAWLERQITGLSITGPSTAQYGDQYTALGFPSAVTWSTSNPSVAGIDPSSGVIHPVSPGTVDVIATCIVNGREKYYKAKTVTVTGTPPVAIRIGAELIDGISYLYAELYSPDSAYNEYLNDENGDLDFHWIYKVDYLTVEHRYSRRAYLYGWENCGYEFFFLGVTVTDTVHNTQSYYSKAFPASAYLTLETPKFVVITATGTYLVSNNNQVSAYDSDSPLIISCSPGFTSGVLTDQMTLVMENGEEYDAMRTNDTWSYYIFEDDELLDNVIDSMGTLEEGKSCCVLMKLVTSDDLPYKQLYIPFFYSNTFLNNQ